MSEFQHKLLDWLEDAFKSASRPSSPEEGFVLSTVCLNTLIADIVNFEHLCFSLYQFT